MKHTKIILILIFCYHNIISQDLLNYPKAKVNFDDYEELVKEVKVVRQERLLSLVEFLAYQKDENTIILDTRSRENFNAVHIKGAINLPFTEFTQNNLRRLIPDTNTRILIYCNNNIEGDQIYFGSKTYSAKDEKERKKYEKKTIYIDKSFAEYKAKFISLALNVPTYINLYGYGYRNIYELNELVSINDKRVKFVRKKKK